MRPDSHWEGFYVPPEGVGDGWLQIQGEEYHHLVRVKRRKAGDRVWVVDGLGTAYWVELTDLGGGEARCQILHSHPGRGEPKTSVTLAQGVIRGERFDWLVEKAVEIGVARIVPILSDYAVREVGPQRWARWRRIAVSAMKQCGRSRLPEVTAPRRFDAFVEEQGKALRFLAEPGPFPWGVPPDKERNCPVYLLVGPEGGFSKEEIALAGRQGFLPVSLGPRRMRAETVGVVFSALVLDRLGEVGSFDAGSDFEIPSLGTRGHNL